MLMKIKANESYRDIADGNINTVDKQLQTGIEFRQPRLDDIRKNEEMYYGKAKPALPGRFNVPIDSVIMEGYIDTLMSEIDNPPKVEFDRIEEQDLSSAKRVTAQFAEDMSETRENLRQKDLAVKKLAALSGFGTFEFFSTGNPYKPHLSFVDHYDFVMEPQGGQILDKHLFKFRMNIFRSTDEMVAGVGAGRYVGSQVQKLISNYNDPDFKLNEDTYQNKIKRFHSIGLDVDTHRYTGNKLFNLTAGVVFLKDKWWWVVFDSRSKIWVRWEPLEEVYWVAKKYPGRGPWARWATHIDPFNCYNKAPADSIRPIAESMRIIFNQTLENIQKRNWDMTAYDGNIFSDPSKLMWRNGGIVKGNVKPGQRLGDGIYKFQTPDTAGVTINLMTFLDQFTGVKLGNSAGLQGGSEEETATVAIQNLEQAKGRLGLPNSQYSQCYVDLATMYDWGLHQNIRTEEMAVKVMGVQGIGWETLTKDDTKPDLKVRISGGNAEEIQNQQKKINQQKALDRIAGDQRAVTFVNPQWLVESILRTGDFDEETIRVAMDTQNFGNEKILAEAADAIDKIVKGQEPNQNRNATLAFQQKIEDWAYDNTDDDNELFVRLMEYSAGHDDIVEENTRRKAREVRNALSVASAVGGEAPAMTANAGLPAPVM